MKKGLIIGVVAAAVLIVMFIPAYISFDFYNDAKDYRQALAVQHKEESSAAKPDDKQALVAQHKEGLLSGKPDVKPGAEIPKIKSDAENWGYISENEGTAGNVINILFMGLDRTEERDKTLGIYRTDTIAVARIDMDAKTVDVLSIPRDTYSYIPVRGKMDKINHAYAFGSIDDRGNESAIEAVEYFINEEIDYYFTIEMEAVPEIIDLIGGVEIDVEIDAAGLSKGKQLLDGDQVLRYIRWRYSGDGDLGRIKRQQKFAIALFDKLRSADQLVNAVKIVLSYKKNVRTNMSLKQIASLAILAGEVSGDSMKFHIIPGEGKMIDKIWYWMPDREKTARLLSEIFYSKAVDIY